MKILMLGWELPPHNSGGLGVACYQLCKALAKNGVDIDFILPYEANHDAPFMSIIAAKPQNVSDVIKSGIAYDSYKYVYDDGSEEWLNIFEQQQLYEKSIDTIVEGREFDIIHAHDWLTFRAGVRAKQKTGKPLILHVHSIEHDRAGNSLGNPLVHEIEHMSFLMADQIIAVSEHTKHSIVKEYSIPADKIQVVHNSLDLDMFEPITQDNDFIYLSYLKLQGYKVVTNVGRLTIQKGLTNLLHAAKLVIERNSKVIFLIVGAGEQYFELIDLAASLGISKNVIFTGFLRGKQWRDAFAIGDLFVMPSVSEPFGLTPLEAAGYGTPSLITHQSGVSEIFANCLKVDYWDTIKMADDILAVVNNTSLQEVLSESAVKEHARLSWHNAADQLKFLYQSHTERVAA